MSVVEDQKNSASRGSDRSFCSMSTYKRGADSLCLHVPFTDTQRNSIEYRLYTLYTAVYIYELIFIHHTLNMVAVKTKNI